MGEIAPFYLLLTFTGTAQALVLELVSLIFTGSLGHCKAQTSARERKVQFPPICVLSGCPFGRYPRHVHMHSCPKAGAQSSPKAHRLG